ncbi:hypothetical protein N657DRAFT_667400 [Parathielavia appendiculata]|uniref:Glyoxalase/fosfomycin resistance/dioxygenase domain-containing protein n=1 Tax=Parathielavia appendiculata TaxID=2587402 RepID=A0AAN6U7T4_9PEZI|nr:hypothetical protein N657DRAFT_667400 [Parathielavia appendiculata]
MSTSASNSPKPTFFLNLPTTSVPSAKAFYTALGFPPLEAWSDAETASFMLPEPNQTMALMVHAHQRFKTFMRPAGTVVDAHTSTETLFSIACENREEVDGWLAKVEGAGGKKDTYVMEGFGEGMGMYCRSWEDLDGHVWEAVAMIGTGGCGEEKGEEEKKEAKKA